jgi:hypothetical protein
MSASPPGQVASKAEDTVMPPQEEDTVAIANDDSPAPAAAPSPAPPREGSAPDSPAKAAAPQLDDMVGFTAALVFPPYLSRPWKPRSLLMTMMWHHPHLLKLRGNIPHHKGCSFYPIHADHRNGNPPVMRPARQELNIRCQSPALNPGPLPKTPHLALPLRDPLHRTQILSSTKKRTMMSLSKFR